MDDLISVIMSTYNEPIGIIEKSVNSILTQTYTNIELIVVNDNPSRNDLENYLQKKCMNNKSLRYLRNEKNIGLVGSLNKALSIVKGKYVARMDADDISDNKRLEKQIKFLIENDLDIVGSEVVLIDELGNIIGSICVPTKFERIQEYYNFGSALLHPTWFMKKSVYDSLKGYRNIQACEDFDFMLRAFHSGFKAGNIPEKLLYYRVRKDGISISLEAKQKLITYFLQSNRKRIHEITVEIINEYTSSKKFDNEFKQINKYINAKNLYKKTGKISIKLLFELMFNKYLYINILNNFRRKIYSA